MSKECANKIIQEAKKRHAKELEELETKDYCMSFDNGQCDFCDSIISKEWPGIAVTVNGQEYEIIICRECVKKALKLKIEFSVR